MRTALLPALLSVAVVAAGCASAKKVQSVTGSLAAPLPSSITVVGSATIPDVKTGTRISCKGWPPGVRVPARGGTLLGSMTKQPMTQSGTGPSSAEELRLKHRQDGSVTVSCRSG